MIDLNLFRCRVGVFNNGVKRSKTVSITGNYEIDTRFLNISRLILYLCVYLYFSLCVLGVVVGMLIECTVKSNIFADTNFREFT